MKNVDVDDALKSEQAKRLTEARKARGFDDAKAAARYFGWNYNTYSQHERGERGLRKDVAERYARDFRVSPAWLMFGQGVRDVGSTIQVVGKIGAGAEIIPEHEQVPSDGLYEIEANIPLPDGMIGFEVKGDSMWPRYDPGDVVIVDAAGTSLNDIPDGAEAAVKTGDGRRFVKHVLREPSGLWTLESHNAPPIRGVTIEWVSEVVSVARRRQWRRLNGKISKK
jgi:phage repressor protein C with HTH and peptisase S24 domain